MKIKQREKNSSTADHINSFSNASANFTGYRWAYNFVEVTTILEKQKKYFVNSARSKLTELLIISENRNCLPNLLVLNFKIKQS